MSKYKFIIDSWNKQADEFNQWDSLGDDEKIEFALDSAFHVLDILPRLWAAGYTAVEQGEEWWLFAPTGDGVVSGKTFKKLCVNIVLEELWLMAKRQKYGNKKVVIDGEKFDSMKEASRYGVLRTMLNLGKIKDLRLQPSFRISKGGIKDPATGRTMAARKYIADFAYVDTATGANIVEDVKSVITAKDSTYRLKRQLFLEAYGADCTFIET